MYGNRSSKSSVWLIFCQCENFHLVLSLTVIANGPLELGIWNFVWRLWMYLQIIHGI